MPENHSEWRLMQKLPKQSQNKILKKLTDEELYFLQNDWEILARPEQKLPIGDWFCWLLRSGRGFGKTRTGAETVIQWAMDNYSPIALIGQTKADVRDTMIEIGDSSIMKVAPPFFMPVYEPSKRRLTFPNGVICIGFSGDKPDQLRGHNITKAWVDELAKFQYPTETWDNLEFAMRNGKNPQVICTTTPRPIPIIKDLIKDKRTIETRGSTLDNAANLNPRFLERVFEKYQGTRLGKQELYGDILDDNPDALWKRSDIDNHRVWKIPQLSLIVVGVDPAVTSNENSDDTGIIVAGKGTDGHGYILGDYTIHDTPKKWAEAVITAYHKHSANKIIGEANNGGDLVESNIKTVDPNIRFEKVNASRGKATRAEPISSLYEQAKIHHFGVFPELEDQMCEWIPGAEKSPDRVDALVWAITSLNMIVNVGKAATSPLPTGLNKKDFPFERGNMPKIWNGNSIPQFR